MNDKHYCAIFTVMWMVDSVLTFIRADYEINPVRKMFVHDPLMHAIFVCTIYLLMMLLLLLLDKNTRMKTLKIMIMIMSFVLANNIFWEIASFGGG